MANINIKPSSPVVIQQPGNQLFQGIGETLLRGLLQDMFHQVRQERTNNLSNLWEGAKMNTETIIGMSDPEQVKNAINEFQQDYDNPSISKSNKERIAPLLNKMGVHYDKMVKQDVVNQSAVVAKGHELDVANILSDKQLYTDVNLLKEGEQEIEDSINDIYNQAIPSLSPEVRESSRQAAISYLEGFKDTEKDFNNKYYKEGYQLDEDGNVIIGEIKDDLTEKELEQMSVDAAFIEGGVKEASRIIDEDTQIMEELDPLEYLRKEDLSLAKVVESMESQKDMLTRKRNVAERQNEFANSVLDFGVKMDDAKLKPEEYGDLSKQYIDKISQLLKDNSAYLDASDKKILDDMDKERRTVMGGFSVLNAIDRLKKENIESDAAKVHLDNALSLAQDGITTENSKIISDAFSSLNKAITEERAFDAKRGQRLSSERRKLEKSTKAKLTPTVKSIASKLGTIEKRAKNLSGKYLPGGEFELSMKPDQYFQSFSLERDANVKAYKDEVGKELATLIKSSDMDSVDKKDRDTVNELANLARQGDFEAADQLYLILKDLDIDMDFYGTGQKDTNVKNIYKQYLNLYRTLYEADVEATEKFGTDYGYGQVIQAGSQLGNTATDESLDWMNF